LNDDLKKLHKISKNLTVLYIEDDTMLLKKTASMFRNIFAEVQTATNGKEGLSLYTNYLEKNDSYFDIVITDIKMPIMDGIVLSKKLKEINPNQLIIVTSAHDESKNLIEFINTGIKKFIKKPFTLEIIVKTFLEVCKEITNQNKNIFIDEYKYWDTKYKLLYENDKEVKLSNNETLLLDLLLNNPNQLFSGADFYYIIQDDNFNKGFSLDSVKSMIKRLRKKLPDNFIENIYGQGYRINPNLFNKVNK